MFTVLLAWINAHYKKDYEPLIAVMMFVDLMAIICIAAVLGG